MRPRGSNPPPSAANPRPVRLVAGRLPLTQRTQVRVLHGSPWPESRTPVRPVGHTARGGHTQGKPACVPPGHDVIQCAQCEVAQRESGWPLPTVVEGSNPSFAAGRHRQKVPQKRSWSNGTTAPRRGAEGSSTLPGRTQRGSEALRVERPVEAREAAVRARPGPPSWTCSSTAEQRSHTATVGGSAPPTSTAGPEPAGTAPP
jgi:hypothetical protein